MAKKEIRNIIPKFKKGNLYLYNPVILYDSTHKKFYSNVPVVALCINKNYPTWLCFFPDGRSGGCHPHDLKDITIKRDT